MRLIVVICLLASAPAWAREIVVAQVAAFTGAQASSGKAIRAGIKLYLDHVNRNGGVGGDRIRLSTYDDGYKAEETVRLVKHILEKEPPIAFIGVLGTANNEAIIKDGVLARDTATGHYQIVSEGELKAIADSDSGPKPLAADRPTRGADVVAAPLTDKARLAAAELSLVSTQFLRKVVNKKDPSGGFNPYDKG